MNLYTDGHEVLLAKDSNAVRDWVVYQYGESALDDAPYVVLKPIYLLTFEETFTDYADHWVDWITINMTNIGMSLDDFAIPCVLIAEHPNELDDPEDDGMFPKLTNLGRRLVGVREDDDDSDKYPF